MAFDFNKLYEGSNWGLATPFDRKDNLPIDCNSLFPSKALADAYATGVEATINTAIAAYKASHADSKIEKLTNNSYVGQIITVIEKDAETGNDVATVYVIEANRTLKAVGTAYDDTELRNLIATKLDEVTGKEAIVATTTENSVEVSLKLAQGDKAGNVTLTQDANGLKADIDLSHNHDDIYVKQETGKGLSTNDLTNDLKTNYDAAYTHSTSAHAPANAQENVIEQIKVNGTAQTITGKAVDITVPTKVSDLTNDSGFLTAAPEYSIVKDADSGDYAAIYHLTKNGTNVGAAINIPKDLVVKSGSVVDNDIILILNDEAKTEIKIPVGDLVEYVTSGSTAGDMVFVTVDPSTHKVTATITDGTITKEKLDSTVQASLKAADEANAYTDAEIKKLDVTITGMGAGKTIKTLTETDGKIAAEFQDIEITTSQISDFEAYEHPEADVTSNSTNVTLSHGDNFVVKNETFDELGHITTETTTTYTLPDLPTPFDIGAVNEATLEFVVSEHDGDPMLSVRSGEGGAEPRGDIVAFEHEDAISITLETRGGGYNQSHALVFDVADEGITTDKIADRAVTKEKLAYNVEQAITIANNVETLITGTATDIFNPWPDPIFYSEDIAKLLEELKFTAPTFALNKSYDLKINDQIIIQNATGRITDNSDYILEFRDTADGTSDSYLTVWQSHSDYYRGSVDWYIGEPLTNILNDENTRKISIIEHTNGLGIEKGAQVNKIESITINGSETPLAIDNKNVNIDINVNNVEGLDGYITGKQLVYSGATPVPFFMGNIYIDHEFIEGCQYQTIVYNDNTLKAKYINTATNGEHINALNIGSTDADDDAIFRIRFDGSKYRFEDTPKTASLVPENTEENSKYNCKIYQLSTNSLNIENGAEVNKINAVSDEFNIVTDADESKDRVLEINKVSVNKIEYSPAEGENEAVSLLDFLDGKANTIHTHNISDVEGFDEYALTAGYSIGETIYSGKVWSADQEISATPEISLAGKIKVNSTYVIKFANNINFYLKTDSDLMGTQIAYYKQFEWVSSENPFLMLGVGGDVEYPENGDANVLSGTTLTFGALNNAEQELLSNNNIYKENVQIYELIPFATKTVATTTNLGLVKSTAVTYETDENGTDKTDHNGNKIVAEESRNKVTVSQDGTMEITAISADRIVQTGDTWLILNGGSASL